MKKILTLIIALSLAIIIPVTGNGIAQDEISIEYSNQSKSLHLTGTIGGAELDEVNILIYDYDPLVKGVADNTLPKVFDVFALAEGGSVNHKVFLPDSLMGGKYVVRVTTYGFTYETTFMHINDTLAPNALAMINAASDGSFADALTAYGPACGLDPDLYQENKASVSSILLSWRGTGFAYASMFLKSANCALAASYINKGEAVTSVLNNFGTYLKDSSIDCKADYLSADPEVRLAFDTAVKQADFTNQRGFCRIFRELLIYKQFEQANSWAEVREVFDGTKDGAVANNNPDILNVDTSDFSQLKNPDEVYKQLYLNRMQIVNYDSLVFEFAKAAEACLISESQSEPSYSSPGSGSVSASGGGSVSTSGMPSVTPELIQGQNTDINLTDIGGHWAEDCIKILAKNNIISGYADSSFKPDNPVTRAEFVKMISAAFNFVGTDDIEFYDVPADFWALDYIKSAYSSGIISGFEDGSFRPDDNISREQAAVMIYRTLCLSYTFEEGISEFEDISQFSDYAIRPILDLAYAGLVHGTDHNIFSPSQSITRAQTAKLINNALEFINSR